MTTTTIDYGLPVAGHVRFTVYDLLGREVAVLVDEKINFAEVVLNKVFE
jgi:hypothetical protein